MNEANNNRINKRSKIIKNLVKKEETKVCDIFNIQNINKYNDDFMTTPIMAINRKIDLIALLDMFGYDSLIETLPENEKNYITSIRNFNLKIVRDELIQTKNALNEENHLVD